MNADLAGWTAAHEEFMTAEALTRNERVREVMLGSPRAVAERLTTRGRRC